jgi:hypothetical protein
MMKTKATFKLLEANTRLEALLAAQIGPAESQDIFRTFADATQPRMLSSGVMQYEQTMIWYSLSGMREVEAPDRVEFKLELATDMPIPESLVVTCVIGRSRIRHRVQATTELVWSAPIADTQNARNHRVDEIKLSLEIIPDA